METKKPPDSLTNIQSFGEMPKLVPGERNSPVFNGDRISEFLEVYELITSKNNPREKTLLFPFYCDKSIQISIKKTVSFESRNWDDFKEMLKRKFKESAPDDPLEPIRLLSSKGTTGENYYCFVEEFEYEARKLEKDGELSSAQKASYFLKAMPYDIVMQKGEEIYDGDKLKSYEQLKEKFLSVCSIKGKLQKILPAEHKEKAEEKNNSSSFNNDTLEELIKDMKALTLMYKSNMEHKNKPLTSYNYQSSRKVSCIYCDGDHRKRDCEILDKDLKSGVVKIGDRGIILSSKGVELPPNWGNGGIKATINHTSNSRAITVQNAELDADIENFSDNHMVQNFNIIHKEDFQNIVKNFAAKRASSENKEIINYKQNKRFKDSNLKDTSEIDENMPLAEVAKKLNEEESSKDKQNKMEFNGDQYKVKANVVNDDLLGILTDKIKDLKIQVSLEELASVSPAVRKSINNEFKLKRVADVREISDLAIKEGDDWKKMYLSVGSGRAVGRINGAEIHILFDEGSEVNLMSLDVYNALNSLGRANMNRKVKWQMKDANSGTSELLGVIENCEIEVERCRSRVHIFVSTSIK
ncbi:hypothetical protein AYI68_g6947 [Smittium mucronatum]|uniref:Uncharacterized protein n=1 Tax=Smittium mucronatum TaxID=133383 RepID=A0A1R0GQ23_9FUNG|nr:hypothetical protein AYI68_g6947 [Smittium mucronatum]